MERPHTLYAWHPLVVSAAAVLAQQSCHDEISVQYTYFFFLMERFFMDFLAFFIALRRMAILNEFFSLPLQCFESDWW